MVIINKMNKNVYRILNFNLFTHKLKFNKSREVTTLQFERVKKKRKEKLIMKPDKIMIRAFFLH